MAGTAEAERMLVSGRVQGETLPDQSGAVPAGMRPGLVSGAADRVDQGRAGIAMGGDGGPGVVESVVKSGDPGPGEANESSGRKVDRGLPERAALLAIRHGSVQPNLKSRCWKSWRPGSRKINGSIYTSQE
jgi:hypothetical protein